MVRTVAGIPVKLDGNPYHPVNRGALCPRGQAGLQFLYHPDRIKTPQLRVGPKGSAEWEPISWDEALDTVRRPLAQLRDKGSPEGLAILGGQYRGLIDRLWARFARVCGTPNYVRARTLSPELPDPVAWFMDGAARPITFDLRETSMVLSFGCEWLEGWNSPVHQMRAYGHMRQGRGGRRAEFVHVGPRISSSGAKADRWIPVRPGTEGVFALGLAHLILREELHDSEFIGTNTAGFENWVDPDGRARAGYRQLVLADYAPIRVSEITGVSPETIVTVARRFARLRPSIALYDDRSPLEGGDLYTWMAIHSLNALVGSIGARGGILPAGEPPPLTPWPEFTPEAGAREGLSPPGPETPSSDRAGSLIDAVLESGDSPIEVLILHRTNPAYGRPDKERFQKAFGKIPLVVSVSGFPDETSQYADLVLPEHHPLESWLDDEVGFLPGFSLFGIGRPAIEPLYDTRAAEDVILSLARDMGEAERAAFPWESYLDLVRFSAEGLYKANRGYVISTEDDEVLREVFQMQGYRLPEYKSFDEFWDALAERGAWWERADPSETVRLDFATPSGKFEFCPRRLETDFGDSARAGSYGSVPGDGKVFFPQVLIGRKDETDDSYPFILRTYSLLTIGPGVGASLPWLQEAPAAHVDAGWESVVEIHPESARKVGIREGDMVWVESSGGRVRLRARLYPGTRDDVVSVATGEGHVDGGRWARGIGVDAADLLQGRTEAGKGPGMGEITRVRVSRA